MCVVYGCAVTSFIASWVLCVCKKEVAHIPPSKVNDPCSTRQILALFRGQPWGDCWETGRSAYGPFWALRCHLELKLKLKLCVCCVWLCYNILHCFSGWGRLDNPKWQIPFTHCVVIFTLLTLCFCTNASTYFHCKYCINLRCGSLQNINTSWLLWKVIYAFTLFQ